MSNDTGESSRFRGRPYHLFFSVTLLISSYCRHGADVIFAEAICNAFELINELWAVPIELGIALYLLQRQLGLAFLAPGLVAFISTGAILIMARYIGNAQKIWIEGIQTRVDVTASMLSSMKARK